MTGKAIGGSGGNDASDDVWEEGCAARAATVAARASARSAGRDDMGK